MSNRSYDYKCLGRSGSFTGPATVEEIERVSGKPGICQEMFMQDYVYQVRNKKMRELVAAKAEAHTGVARKTKTEGSGDNIKTTFAESEQDYINRLTLAPDATTSAILSDADFATIWEESNNEVGDWSAADLGSGRKPAKPFQDAAEGILAKIASKYTNPDGTVASAERTTQALEAYLGVSFSAAYGEFNQDNLARALRDRKEKQDRESVNAVL